MSQPRLKTSLWIACAVLIALLIGINAVGKPVTAQDVSPQTSTPRGAAADAHGVSTHEARSRCHG